MTMGIDNYKNLKNKKIKYGLFSEDTIYIELKSKSDPHGKCVEYFEVKWVQHFACGSYAPKIKLEASQIKFLATRPDILNIFIKMQGGQLDMDIVLEELSKIGERKDLGNYLTDGKTIDVLYSEKIEREFEKEFG